MAAPVLHTSFCKLGQFKILNSSNFRVKTLSAFKNCDRRCFCESPEQPTQEDNDEIARIRDKSKLPAHIKQIYFEGKSTSNPNDVDNFRKNRIEYNRKLYARFGEQSNVNPGIMWPSKQGLKDRIAFEEKIHLPLDKLMSQHREKQIEAAEIRRKREEEIRVNLAKVEIARKSMLQKIEQQEEKARQLQEKKDNLINEVREFLGYTVDAKDPRFKELLEAKEKEQKKKDKEAKKKERQKKLLARLAEASAAASKNLNVKTENAAEKTEQ